MQHPIPSSMGAGEVTVKQRLKKKKILCVSWKVMLFPHSVIIKQLEGV